MGQCGRLICVLNVVLLLSRAATGVQAATSSFSDEGPQQSKTGPTPPPGVSEKVREASAFADGEVVIVVPGYSWRHGCGSTAVGMVVGYYDTVGYRGLIPGDAHTQTGAVNQAIASGGNSSNPNPPGAEQHYEDYASPQDYYPNLLADDYITQGRPAHADNCIADYMDTSKSTRNNYYGWSWSGDVGPSFVSYVNQQNYLYSPSYQQYRMSTTLTWGVLTTEIDNGRPMVFLVDSDGDGGTDHFVTIVGYRSTPSQQYGCLDTWQPADVVRWCDFEPISDGQPWGIWGGWSFSPGPIPGDFDTDGDVDWHDLDTLRQRWLDYCSVGEWCGGCDINHSERVDFADFAILAEHWLGGLQP